MKRNVTQTMGVAIAIGMAALPELLPAASAAGVLELGPQALQDVNDLANPIATCTSSAQHPMLPATTPIQGNGQSTAQFFQDPVTGEVAVTYRLVANTLNNGADDWLFGYQLSWTARSPDQPGQTQTAYNVGVDKQGSKVTTSNQFATCLLIGYANPYGFDVFIDAGDGGWTSTASCTIGVNFEIDVGISLSTDAVGVKEKLGVSLSCMKGGTYDSESLLRGTAHGSSVCPSCYVGVRDPVSPGNLTPLRP